MMLGINLHTLKTLHNIYSFIPINFLEIFFKLLNILGILKNVYINF